MGNIANGQIQVRFIEDKLHGKWQHSIVVVYQLVWYDADASNVDTRKEYHLPLMHSNSVITVPGNHTLALIEITKIGPVFNHLNFLTTRHFS